MRNNIAVVVVYLIAVATNERLSLLIDSFKLMRTVLRWLILKSFYSFLLDLLVMLHALIVALPNVAHLSNWTKIGSLQLIQEMVKVI